MLSDMTIEDVFTGSVEDYSNNAHCIAAAVRDAETFALLKPKLLKPFTGADKMFEAVSQLKRLLEGNGSRLQAMDVVTSCGLCALEQRTLVAACFLLFDEASGGPDRSPPVAVDHSHGAVVGASLSEAVHT